jgi:hypothetical protein
MLKKAKAWAKGKIKTFRKLNAEFNRLKYLKKLRFVLPQFTSICLPG